MSMIKTASYHPDHTPHLLDLLSQNTNKSKSGDSRIDFEDIESDMVNNLATTAIVNLDFVDKNVVSYIGGWVAFKLKSLLKDCGECCDSLTSPSSVDDDLKLTVVKSRGVCRYHLDRWLIYFLLLNPFVEIWVVNCCRHLMLWTMLWGSCCCIR